MSFGLSVKAPVVVNTENKTEIMIMKKKIAKMQATLGARIKKVDTYGIVSIEFTKRLKQVEDIVVYS